MDENSTPILHSMNRDTVNGAKNSVGSFNVTNEEALLLAKMQTESSKKRKFNLITIIAIVVLFISISLVLLPDKFFIRKDTGIEVSQKVSNFLNADNFYQITKPTGSELDSFKSKNFSNSNGISVIEIVENGQLVSFNFLAPFISDRFISTISTASVHDYIYGFTKTKENTPAPYLAFVVGDPKIANENLISLERTMYTDLSYVLKLPDIKQNELLQFENYDSVRNPARYMRDLAGQVLIVYGFPMDNVVLVTNSLESYEILKNRMLLGY